MKIAVVLVATGAKFRDFLKPLVPRIRENFIGKPDILLVSDIDSWPGVHAVHRVDHLPLPLPSLFRHHWICQMADTLRAYDYFYYLDVDSDVVRPLGTEVLRPLIAVRHWCWPTDELTARAPFEPNPASKAYVDAAGAGGYFQASFQGGETERYLEANQTIRSWIEHDLTNGAKGCGGRIARWYDESYWNRYVNTFFSEFEILGPEYALGPIEWSFAPSLLTHPGIIHLRAKPGDEDWGKVEVRMD